MRALVIGLMLLVVTTVTACNTMEGAGQDIQAGGKKLERSANENK